MPRSAFRKRQTLVPTPVTENAFKALHDALGGFCDEDDFLFHLRRAGQEYWRRAQLAKSRIVVCPPGAYETLQFYADRLRQMPPADKYDLWMRKTKTKTSSK